MNTLETSLDTGQTYPPAYQHLLNLGYTQAEIQAVSTRTGTVYVVKEAVRGRAGLALLRTSKMHLLDTQK